MSERRITKVLCNFETKMHTPESFVPVTQLETKKSSAETYRTFYELYGEEPLRKQGTHGWRHVLNRVLHFDQDDSRNVHVVVARSNQSINPPMLRRYDARKLPRHLIPYRPNDFMVAATDGQTITAYDVRNAVGIYENHINGIDKHYDPRYEKLRLSLTSEEGKSHAEFQYASGNGVFDLLGYPVGWILSEAESMRLQALVVRDIGHAAIAS